MSDAPEQAMKRANATDSAEYTLSAMHARDYQERLAKKHPARWRLLKGVSPAHQVAVTRENRLVTIEVLVKDRLLRPCDGNDETEDVRLWRWRLTGWGLMVQEAEPGAGVYTRTAANQ